jgi:hypothetical protein
MAYRVMKPIQSGDGTVIPAGELVEAGGWRTLRQLINGRYLVEVVEAEVVEPTPPVKKKKPAQSDTES